jgi:hypothetical protein
VSEGVRGDAIGARRAQLSERISLVGRSWPSRRRAGIGVEAILSREMTPSPLEWEAWGGGRPLPLLTGHPIPRRFDKPRLPHPRDVRR